jgi:hypothetical protein
MKSLKPARGNTRRPGSLAVVLVSLLVPVCAWADRAAEVAALEARCEMEREAKIKPLRDKEIANCLANRSDADYCHTFWKDYGNAVRTPNGGMVPRMFDDLRSCVAAFEARREFELNGR